MPRDFHSEGKGLEFGPQSSKSTGISEGKSGKLCFSHSLLFLYLNEDAITGVRVREIINSTSMVACHNFQIFTLRCGRVCGTR